MAQIHFDAGKGISKRFKYLSTSHVNEVFPDSFMKDFTKHKNFTDFCQAIGCDISSQEDLYKLQETNEFDNAIRSCSDFNSWQDMVQTAFQRLLDQK